MKTIHKLLVGLVFGLFACVAQADGYVDENGIRWVCSDTECYPVDANGNRLEMSDLFGDDVPAPLPEVTPEVVETPRLAQGYMDVEDFLAFLNNEEPTSSLADKSWWLILILVLFGGLCMNLTPCVLPMMPINLMVIGKSATRGALYGLGIALAYGAMGLLAALGGMAFGEIQGNPWFNVGIAVLFVLLGLALMEVFFIDLSKHRAGAVKKSSNKFLAFFFPFFMGCVSAVLAGACVAPILIAVLLLTADLTAQGNYWALALPFVLGLGMALPWPLAGAGLKVLPKPGGWMKKVNTAFGILVFGFAAWYGYLAYQGFTEPAGTTSAVSDESVINLASPAEFNLAGLKRPVLVDCWATWCKNCTAMEHKTLADEQVKAVLKDYTVIRLQAEDMKALLSLPGFGEIRGLPAFLIFE